MTVVQCCSVRAKRRLNDAAAYAPLLKALADDTRLAILGLLAGAGGQLCACQAQVGRLSQPTISHHLKLLREAGLVTAQRRGTWIHYAVNKPAVARLRELATLLGG